MEIGKEITQILLPGLDDENCISVENAMQLLEQAEFDLEGIGVTDNEGEGLADILGDLDSFFEILTNEDQNIIKCKVIPQQQEEQQPATITQEQSPEEIATLYRRIGGVIRSLMRINDYPNGLVPLTDLGQEMRAQNHVLPPGEKISSFLRKASDKFEIINDETDAYVRLVKEGNKQLADSQVNPQPILQERKISLYDIFDFAYFNDYKEAERKLAEMAEEDDWFVVPDEAAKDQYALLDYKLRTHFAMLVKAQLLSEGEGIKVALNKASFDTGFITSTGQPIIAHFTLNVQRSNIRWQTYEFAEFREAEG